MSAAEKNLRKTGSFREKILYPNRKELPFAEEAVQFAIDTVNTVLVQTFPTLNTPCYRAKLLAREQIIFVDPSEFPSKEKQHKKATDITSFLAVVDSGVPLEKVENFVYGISSDAEFYADCDGDKPVMYIDSDIYTLISSQDDIERAAGLDSICTNLINVDLAVLPDTRILPKNPWTTPIKTSVEKKLLPLIHNMMIETGISDLNIFIETNKRILATLGYKENDGKESEEDSELKEKTIVNDMMNAFFNDDQSLEEVEWEVDKNSRIVARGAKVFYLLPWQKLPTFEFCIGITIDTHTRGYFIDKAVRNYYIKMIERFKPALFDKLIKNYSNGLFVFPPIYTDLGISEDDVFSLYATSVLSDRLITDALQYPT